MHKNIKPNVKRLYSSQPLSNAIKLMLATSTCNSKSFTTAMEIYNKQNREYIHRTVTSLTNHPDFIKSVSKPFGDVEAIRSGLELQNKKIQESLRSLHETFEKQVKESYKRYSKLEPLIISIGKEGWVISPYISLSTVKDIKKLPKEEWANKFSTIYEDNNHRQFFVEFDELINSGFEQSKLDQGYLDELKKIRNLLDSDFSNYEVLIPTAFTVLEFKLNEKLGLIDTSETIKIKSVPKIKNKALNADDRNILSLLSFRSVAIVLDKYYSYKEFQDGIDDTEFSRHSVQHGRFNPLRYEENDIIKIILLIAALCENENINGTLYKDVMENGKKK